METRDHSATLTVAAVYRDVPGFDGYLVGPADLAQLRAGLDLAGGYARAADGVSHDALVRVTLEDAVAGFPGAEGRGGSATDRDDDLATIDESSLYRTLIALATLVGLFGIVNILTLSTVERRREIGLLRAVGMDDGR